MLSHYLWWSFDFSNIFLATNLIRDLRTNSRKYGIEDDKAAN
jgi:hypothetical protein